MPWGLVLPPDRYAANWPRSVSFASSSACVLVSLARLQASQRQLQVFDVVGAAAGSRDYVINLEIRNGSVMRHPPPWPSWTLHSSCLCVRLVRQVAEVGSLGADPEPVVQLAVPCASPWTNRVAIAISKTPRRAGNLVVPALLGHRQRGGPRNLSSRLNSSSSRRTSHSHTTSVDHPMS